MTEVESEAKQKLFVNICIISIDLKTIEMLWIELPFAWIGIAFISWRENDSRFHEINYLASFCGFLLASVLVRR